MHNVEIGEGSATCFLLSVKSQEVPAQRRNAGKKLKS